MEHDDQHEIGVGDAHEVREAIALVESVEHGKVGHKEHRAHQCKNVPEATQQRTNMVILIACALSWRVHIEYKAVNHAQQVCAAGTRRVTHRVMRQGLLMCQLWK